MDNVLYQLSVQDTAQFWNGVTHPPHTTVADLYQTPAFRAPAAYHGKYDVVWSIERPISLQGWKILIDELIVLLKPKGKLVIKYVQNQNISIPSLKNYLFRKYGLRADLDYESIEDGMFTSVFDIERLHYVEQQQKSWTFGILTQGKKVDTVARFCRSVRDYGGAAHQILICGPEHEAYSAYGVQYNKKEYSRVYSDICVKKNDLAAMAVHENVMLLHDRYYLNPDFFTGYEIYGYDFEFMTVQQYHASGKIYPALCAIADRGNLIWGQIIQPINDKELWQKPYINGGLVIAKRHVLKHIPFNSLIFHNQAEDVELATEMLHAGIIAKLNSYSSAVTDVPDHLTEVFQKQYTSDYSSVSVDLPGSLPTPGALETFAAKGFLDRVLVKSFRIARYLLTARLTQNIPWRAIIRLSIGLVLRKCGLRRKHG